MSTRRKVPRTPKAALADERSFLGGALPTVAISPEFADALKATLDIDTVEELIRFDWRSAPASFGPGYTRENVFEARGIAIFYLDGFRERALTSQPIDPLDNDIASEVTSMVIVDQGLQQAQRWTESIEAFEKVAFAARDLAFELKRWSHRVPGVWPPWPVADVDTSSPPVSSPTPPRPVDPLPTMQRLLLPGIAQRLTPKANDLRRRLVDNLGRRYRAAMSKVSGRPESALLRPALRLSDGQALPENPPLSPEPQFSEVEALALAFSSAALAIAVERAQLPSNEELAQQRRGPVGAIPLKGTLWADLERWRERRGISYYRIAKVIMAWPTLRSHFDPDYDLDLTVPKLEKRLRRLLKRPAS